MQRFDTFAITATKTDEGFIRDAPIVGRSGVLRYLNADGSERVEYRPPDEAFNVDSLASLEGKPITIGHRGMVTSDSAAAIKPVGTVLSRGRQDGETIRADVVIYNLDTAARELSCGYRLDLDETPGVTPDGQHYDAIQRNIRYNHVAIVPKGRAGIARLNMDGSQVVAEENPKEDKKMAELTKIRLDSGIEYDCAPEVKVEIERLRADKAESAKTLDTLQAKYDAAMADLAKEKEARKQDAEDAQKRFDEAVKARVEILSVAKEHGIDKADAMTDAEIKKAVISKVRGVSINLDGKSTDYIDAAFDICRAETGQHEDAMAQQREATMTAGENDDADDTEAAYERFKAAEAALYMKGRED